MAFDPSKPHLTTARDIIRETYHASDRTDLDYHIGPDDVVVLHDGESALCIGDEWETDADGQSQHVGYSWTTWAMERTEEDRLVVGHEDCWDEGGSPTEVEARAHVATWLAPRVTA